MSCFMPMLLVHAACPSRCMNMLHEHEHEHKNKHELKNGEHRNENENKNECGYGHGHGQEHTKAWTQTPGEDDPIYIDIT